MNTLPAPSTATPRGALSAAPVAGEPSLQVGAAEHGVPFPATVEIVVPDTSRTSLSPVSAMNTLPAPSTATPRGALSAAPVAGEPSLQVGAAEHAVPFPA